MKKQKTKKAKSREIFHKLLEQVHVMYKSDLLGDDQRVTVAAYLPKEGTIQFGFSFRSPKDQHNKKKAKELAAARAIFTPQVVLHDYDTTPRNIYNSMLHYKKKYEYELKSQ